jgi:uncharacterized protein
MILRFRVANHRSIRDEAVLSLVSTSMRGATPPGGDWRAATNRVAGIYGANASGKTTVLDAVDWFVSVVRSSATSWAEWDQLGHHPFLLDQKHAAEASLYELDFVAEDVRYSYGFRSLASGITDEWLYSYPAGRKRLLFERTGQDFEFGRHLGGENLRLSKAVRPTALYLSTAANGGHESLRSLQRWITHRLRLARLDEGDRQNRLRWIMQLIEDEDARRAAEALVRFADFGVNGVELHTEPMPDDLRADLRSFLQSLLARTRDNPDEAADQALAGAEKQFRFVHSTSVDEAGVRLRMNQESSGTIAWLSLAVPAVDTLRKGYVFLVDEIDSSLHPNLTAELISMFKDPEMNRLGAQLIFTSHDTSLLGTLHGKVLAPEEVWLAEKSAEGATELFSVAEFSVRERDNLERRYLHGRYGGVPIISRTELRRALADRNG